MGPEKLTSTRFEPRTAQPVAGPYTDRSI
jgi:hypothetical protein